MEALVHDRGGHIALLGWSRSQLAETSDAYSAFETREGGCLKVAIRRESDGAGAVRSAVHREAPAQTIGVSTLCGKVD